MRSRAFPDLIRLPLLLLAGLLAGCQPAPSAPEAPATPAARNQPVAGCMRCHTGHTAPLPTENPMMRGLSDLDPARPDGLHSCTSCHGGTPAGSSLEEIHSGGLPFGMIPAFAPNPTSAESVMYACGMCHRNHVRRIENSAMNGFGTKTSKINKLPEKPDAQLVGSASYKSYHASSETASLDCAGACHVFAPDGQQGCSSCHMPEGSPLRAAHALGGQENLIEPATCLQCHNGGYQLGPRYLGQAEEKPARLARSPWHAARTGTTADLHARAGMVCQDCHSSIDIHGDGTATRGTEIECSDCHGSADRAPWQLPVGWMDQAVTTASPPRGTTRKLLNFQRHGVYIRNADHLITARGNPLQHTARDGNAATMQSWTGTQFQIPQLHTAASSVQTLHRQHGSALECYSCHTGTSVPVTSAEAGLLAPLVPGVTYADGQALPAAARNPHNAIAKPRASCKNCHTP